MFCVVAEIVGSADDQLGIQPPETSSTSEANAATVVIPTTSGITIPCSVSCKQCSSLMRHCERLKRDLASLCIKYKAAIRKNRNISRRSAAADTAVTRFLHHDQQYAMHYVE